MPTDLRAIVECLFAAHYSAAEIIDYLRGPLGVAEYDALVAVQDFTGSADIAPA